MEAVDHPATFMKSNVFPQLFLFYNETNGPKLQNTPHFLHLQETLSLNFLEMNFPNIVFIIIQLNMYWERFSCWVMDQKSYWLIKLHDFSDSNLSLTTFLFGISIIDMPSVLKVLQVTLEIDRHQKYKFLSAIVCHIACFVDQWTATTAQDFDCLWFWSDWKKKRFPKMIFLIQKFNLSQCSQYSIHKWRIIVASCSWCFKLQCSFFSTITLHWWLSSFFPNLIIVFM